MEPFPVTRVAHVRLRHAQPAWLVHKLWAEQAVGFVGGTPKTGKTWLALELAVAVASGKACLGCYQVHERGSVLMYAAEDTAEAIRQRVVNIATVRGVGDIERLALGLITVPGLRLDDPDHQERLALTVAKLTPRLLVLDPLVRLHRGDENSSADVSQLLAFLRQLQREHAVAIALVHHMRKSASSQAGQALRGSGDLHAWSDSSLYMLRRKGRVELHAEHRSHPSPDPVVIELRTEPTPHLSLLDEPSARHAEGAQSSLTQQVLDALAEQPMTRNVLRQHLCVRNERLGQAIAHLETQGRIRRTDGLLIPVPAP